MTSQVHGLVQSKISKSGNQIAQSRASDVRFAQACLSYNNTNILLFEAYRLFKNVQFTKELSYQENHCLIIFFNGKRRRLFLTKKKKTIQQKTKNNIGKLEIETEKNTSCCTFLMETDFECQLHVNTVFYCNFQLW